jgi:hypothetical protein
MARERTRRMSVLPAHVAAGINACIRVAGIAAMALISACATPPMAVKTDPRFTLAQIRSVYLEAFASPDDHRDAGRIMTQALKEQLQADGILRVVDQPGLADAYVQGTVETWVQGGLERSGTRPTRIGGSLTLLDPQRRPLWSVIAEQGDPCASWPMGSSHATPVHWRPMGSARCSNTCRAIPSKGALEWWTSRSACWLGSPSPIWPGCL